MLDVKPTNSKHPASFQKADERAFLFFYGKMKNPVFDVVMPALSRVGNSGLLWIIGSAAALVVGVLWMKLPLLGPVIEMLIAMGISEFAAEGVVKKIWWRDRPYNRMAGVTLRVPVKRYARSSSFPSGHTAAYICSAVSLSMSFHALAPVFIAVGLCGAFSRVYVGAHYPSDVAAGGLIGVAFALGVNAVFHPYIWGLVVKAVGAAHLARFLIH